MIADQKLETGEGLEGVVGSRQLERASQSTVCCWGMQQAKRRGRGNRGSLWENETPEFRVSPLGEEKKNERS